MRFWVPFTIVAICCLMMANPGQTARMEGIVLYFPFDEGKGDTVEDLSDNRNHGALIGDPKWVEGKWGSALQFDGAENSNYVEAPDHPGLNPATEITCAAWIYFDEFRPTGGIISKFIGAGNQRSYGLHLHHTEPLGITAACSSDGASGATATVAHSEAGVLAEGQWQHVAMTYKAKDAVRIYVNGELIAESDDAIDRLFDNDTTFIVGTDFDPGGAHGAGQAREFTGIIDDVVIFNRALSQNEIRVVMDGQFMSVESCDKLAVTWGDVKD